MTKNLASVERIKERTSSTARLVVGGHRPRAVGREWEGKRGRGAVNECRNCFLEGPWLSLWLSSAILSSWAIYSSPPQFLWPWAKVWALWWFRGAHKADARRRRRTQKDRHSGRMMLVKVRNWKHVEVHLWCPHVTINPSTINRASFPYYLNVSICLTEEQPAHWKNISSLNATTRLYESGTLVTAPTHPSAATSFTLISHERHRGWGEACNRKRGTYVAVLI